MWVEDNIGEEGEVYSQVVYEHYEKEMVAKRVIDKDSALPERVKRTTLAQEVIRILRNTSETIREGKKAGQLTKFKKPHLPI